MSQNRKDQDRKFDLLTRRYSDEDKELLFSYREALNELLSLGIKPEQTSGIVTRLEANKIEQLRLQKQMVELKKEYKELSKLKSYIDLANDDRFLRGPLFLKNEPATNEDIHTEHTARKDPEQGHKQSPEPKPEDISRQ